VSRFDEIDAALADLAPVHENAPGGVWHTEQDLYRWIAEVLPEGGRTLETGLGVSTVLFAKWSSAHTCIVPVQSEVDAVVKYCAERDIDLSHVEFIVESSVDALPRWKGDERDLLLVDGLHGFPAAIVDWFYGSGHVRQQGFVAIDDIKLASVSLGLLDFLRVDPRWEVLTETRKWIGLRRLSSGPLPENWTKQPFLRTPTRSDRFPAAVRPGLRAAHRWANKVASR